MVFGPAHQQTALHDTVEGGLVSIGRLSVAVYRLADRSAVYFHFADSEALFTAAFDRVATPMCDDTVALPGRATRPLARLSVRVAADRASMAPR